jgi:hypothetical protein
MIRILFLLILIEAFKSLSITRLQFSQKNNLFVNIMTFFRY